MAFTISRRRFLGVSAAGAAALLASRPAAAATRVNSSAVRIGFIGLGAAGLGHLRQLLPHAAALCDVDADRLAHARGLVEHKVLETRDYRQVLESPDIDAVVIATPDHWHAYQAVHACQAGKDLLLETPLGTTPGEAAAVVEAVKRFGRVAQTVLWAPETVVQSASGPWTCWSRPNPTGGDPNQTGPPPASLDWDMWLGPAAERPYNPSWAHHYFRWMLDLGGGGIQQEGIQVLAAAAQWADMQLDAPLTVTATGLPPAKGLWNCPVDLHVTYEQNGREQLVWTQQPAEWPSATGFKAPGDDAQAVAFEAGSESSVGLYANWIECLQTRKTPQADVAQAYRATMLALLGNLAWQLGRPLTWDPAARAFVNDPQADRLIDRLPRAPWRL
jgi:hypothetical protein